jgi:hypothetical protein
VIGDLPNKPANTTPKPTWYATDTQIAEINEKIAAEEKARQEQENSVRSNKNKS